MVSLQSAFYLMPNSCCSRSSCNSAIVPQFTPALMGSSSPPVVQFVISKVPKEPAVIVVDDDADPPPASSTIASLGTPIVHPDQGETSADDGKLGAYMLVFGYTNFMLKDTNANQNECVAPSAPTQQVAKPDSLTAAIQLTHHEGRSVDAMVPRSLNYFYPLGVPAYLLMTRPWTICASLDTVYS
jgi:hypothetical protein